MKVGIVGSGLVGATAAYALIMRGVGREIVLVDRNQARAEAEADDLFHAVPFANPLLVRAGTYTDLAGCQAIILTAGVNQKPGETRLELLTRNAVVFGEIVPAVLDVVPDAVLIVATNPVDVMTQLTSILAARRGVPSTRVIGSGTTLDTARFRTLIGGHLLVDPHHVHAYVIGEHGDSEVLVWSLVTVAGLPLNDFVRERRLTFDAAVRTQIDEQVRRAAYRIIAGKGATYYGIGSALARIVDVVLHDQRAVLTICSRTDRILGVADVTLSLPHLVGGQGAVATIPLRLDTEEDLAIQRSAGILQDAIDAVPVPT